MSLCVNCPFNTEEYKDQMIACTCYMSNDVSDYTTYKPINTIDGLHPNEIKETKDDHNKNEENP